MDSPRGRSCATNLLEFLEKVTIRWWLRNLSCGCCHVTGHSPPPPVLLLKNMLSCGCCHVTGNVVLWMLSCHRTPPLFLLWENTVCCSVDVVKPQDTLSYGCFHVTGHPHLFFIMGNICCPGDVVMSQDTLSYGCCHGTGHSPLVLLYY